MQEDPDETIRNTRSKKRGRNKKARGKPRKELPIAGSELFAKWKAGRSAGDLSKEYGVSPGTIRNRLKECDKESYASIARSRKPPRSNGRRRELPIPNSELYEQWKNGESAETLARKYRASRQTISRRLREYNEQEYGEIAKRKIATSIAERRKNIPVAPAKLMDRWKSGESAGKLAHQFNVSRSTITKILEKYGDNDYRRMAKERMTRGKAKEIPISEASDRWKKGERIKDLAKRYGVSFGAARRKLMENDENAYREIARINRARRGKEKLSVSDVKLFQLWKNGKSTRALAKKLGVSRQTISRRLKEYNAQEYSEVAKKKIAAKISEIAKEKKISIPTDELSKLWENGKSTATLARENKVSRQTISRILIKRNRAEYQTIAKHRIITARTKELLIPMPELFDRWENGESPEKLEKECGISYRQILNKLRAYDKDRYKKNAERRGLGSIRAKNCGVDSLFELNVGRILERHGILSKRTTLKFGKHNYRPDFLLLERNTIIEAMGLSFDWYWRRNKQKTRDYLHHKYKVVAVVPTGQVYWKAKGYLSRKVKILKYAEFERFVSTCL